MKKKRAENPGPKNKARKASDKCQGSGAKRKNA